MHEQNFHNSMINLNRILTAAWGAYGVYANLRSVSEEERCDFLLLFLNDIYIGKPFEFCLLDLISLIRPMNQKKRCCVGGIRHYWNVAMREKCRRR